MGRAGSAANDRSALMRIAVTGAGGGLGGELPHVFTDDDVTLLTQAECDVTDAKQVESAIRRANPEVIIHAAAYTAVDRAESEPKIAERVNVGGTTNVARAAKKIGATLVYPSTDYVFDGRQTTPYTEEDSPNPLSVYGRTKLEGERAALAEHNNTYVVRTSWLYSQGGKSFVTTMLKLFDEKTELGVVSDETSSPTYARDFARGLQRLLEARPEPGTYHLSAGGEASWFEFAREIAKRAEAKVKIKPITAAEWNAPAKRPAYSNLDCTRLAKQAIELPVWKEGLNRFFADQA